MVTKHAILVNEGVTIMGEFSRVLRELRLKRNLSQEEMASLLGTSKQVVSRYELGQRTPKVSTLKAWAEKLGVPEERLLKTEDEIRAMLSPEAIEEAGGDIEEAFSWAVMMGDVKIDKQISASAKDADRLEALHQNPRLGLLFDRAKNLDPEDVDFMLTYAERILRERDGGE